jgi:hypothetical protein
MSEASRSMTALLQEHAGKGRVRVTPTHPENHAAMNSMFRGEASQVATDPATGEPADELEARAQALGCIDVPALRQILPELEELAGAALESALQRTLREREYLAPSIGARLAARPEGLDGGAGQSLKPGPPSIVSQMRAAHAMRKDDLQSYARMLDDRFE